MEIINTTFNYIREHEFHYFVFSLLTYYSFYLFTNYYMQFNSDYKSLPLDRQNYFKKNIVKSFALSVISILCTQEVSRGLLYSEWNNNALYKIGFMYSALDTLGLIMVKKLPLNSKIHHVSTFILSICNTFVKYDNGTFWIGLPIYCVLSAYALSVNLFLALRLLYPLEKLRSLLDFSLYSYVLLLTINWLFQFNIFCKTVYNLNITFDFILYFLLVIFLAYDDIKLVQFLRYHSNKLRIKNGGN